MRLAVPWSRRARDASRLRQIRERVKAAAPDVAAIVAIAADLETVPARLTVSAARPPARPPSLPPALTG